MFEYVGGENLKQLVEREGPLNFYSLYRAHNLHFIVYSAMFEGNSRAALDAADELAGQLTPELLAIESPPMADWLENRDCVACGKPPRLRL